MSREKLRLLRPDGRGGFYIGAHINVVRYLAIVAIIFTDIDNYRESFK
jgi:hypothetical protein